MEVLIDASSNAGFIVDPYWISLSSLITGACFGCLITWLSAACAEVYGAFVNHKRSDNNGKTD